MLPNRNDFCEKLLIAGQPLYFLPNKFLSRSHFGKYSFIDIIGIAETGQKMLVRMKNLPIFVDAEDTEQSRNLAVCYRNERVTALPGIGISKPKVYIRIHFNTIKERINFIKENHGKFFMGNDDANYEYFLIRELNINSAAWNWVKHYKVINTEDSIKLPIQVEIEAGGLTAIDETPPHLIKDKSIICAWDLETYTANIYGGVPQPGNLSDTIQMYGIVFKYYWSDKPIVTFLITRVPIKIPGVYVIKVADNGVEVFKKILEAMQPDFITGFNDGSYDWPFVKKRISDVDEFTKAISCIKTNLKYESHLAGPMSNNRESYNRAKIIKIEANTPPAEYNGYVLPGCIGFDTMIVMRRLNKNCTKYSLNTFLQKYGLEQKEDMHYTTMSKIFYLWSLTTPEKISLLDPQSIPFANDPKMGAIAINNLTAAEILELFALTNSVGTYCIRDSNACIDLLMKVNTVPDFRDFVNKAGCPLEDAFYKADGIKVRNCILRYARVPEWGCWPKKYSLLFSVYTRFIPTKPGAKEVEKKKFPGGYVRVPDSGVYSKIGDRPCSGDDAESLYPSIIRAFNISPEYFAKKPLEGLEFKKISTHYKFDSEAKSKETKIRGYFLKSTNSQVNGEWRYENFGIIPTILNRFFIDRKKLKGLMFKWEIILEKLKSDAKGLKTKEEICSKLNECIEAIRKKASFFKGKKQELELAKIKNYTLAIGFIEQEWAGDIKDLYERSVFNFNYYNTKQLTIKVFMNTFYGEMGNVDSPFFIPEMGGAVTKMGRTFIKDVGRFVEERGFRIYYGDTDSLYISPPESAFEDADEKFKSGELGQEQYYEEMVGITMNRMNEITEETNSYLVKKYGNPFLRMAYEEVLFPFGFFGKKNYFGVKHFNSIDFSLCRTTDKAKFEKDIYARGIPLRRRDASRFLKGVLVDMLMAFCSFTEKRDYETIIVDIIEHYIKATMIEPDKYKDMVVKSYSFKEPRENSRTTQMKFRSKMMKLYIESQVNKAFYIGGDEGQKILRRFIDGDGNFLDTSLKMEKIDVNNYEIDKNLLGLEITVPNYGERYDLVVARCPHLIKMNGRADKTPKGELLEFVSMIGNDKYANYLRAKYEKAGVILENFSGVEIAFEEYFKALFGTLGRYMLFFKEYKLAIKNAVEINMQKLSGKEALKKAEADQIKIIKKDLIARFSNFHTQIKYNVEGTAERFIKKEKEFFELAGRGVVAKEIFKYFITPSYELANIKKVLVKLLDEKKMALIKVNALVIKQLDSNRTSHLVAIENGLSSLMDSIAQVCAKKDEFSIRQIPQLDTTFKKLCARRQLEYYFEAYTKSKNVSIKSMNESILNAFLN